MKLQISYKLSSARIPIENSFGRLNSCFVLRNYWENKKENLPDQNLMTALIFEKRAQPSTSPYPTEKG